MAQLGDTTIYGDLRILGEFEGNASSATKLKIPVTINGVPFDGTENITVEMGAGSFLPLEGGTLTGDLESQLIIPSTTDLYTLGSETKRWSNVYSSLFTGDLKGDVTGNVTGDVTGNADTATQLQKAVTINGTMFDGSGNITTSKWGVPRAVAVSDATNMHSGTAVEIDGSATATLPLPDTITATLKGNADTATLATTAERLANDITINGIPFDGTEDIFIATAMRRYDAIATIEGWKGETPPYTQEISIPEITENDIVNVYPLWGSTPELRKIERENYAKFCLVESYEGGIKITCDEEKPEIVINLTVEVPSGGRGEGPDPTYIRIYSSVEEMEADTSAGPNDMGLVYHEGIFTGLYQHSINAWGIAETQLTLTESGEILPDIIAFGKNGIVTGDGSIWNNTLSPDEYQQALDTAKDIKGDKE